MHTEKTAADVRLGDGAEKWETERFAKPGLRYGRKYSENYTLRRKT